MQTIANLPVINTNRFELGHFTDRLDHVMAATNDYRGTLFEAWQDRITHQPIDELGHHEGLLPLKVDPTVKRELELLCRRVGNTGAQSVSIESAHVYAYEDPLDPSISPDIIRQARAASALSALLRNKGMGVTFVQFIDDYNAKSGGIAASQDYNFAPLREALLGTGFHPTVYFREAAMAPLAHEMIGFMREQGLVIERGQIDLESPQADSQLSHRNIELFNGQLGKLSCAMLDSALTMVKLRFLGDAVVNILPRKSASQSFGYKSQQFKMRRIVGDHLATRIVPVFNLFIDTESAPAPATAGTHHSFRKKPLNQVGNNVA